MPTELRVSGGDAPDDGTEAALAQSIAESDLPDRLRWNVRTSCFYVYTGTHWQPCSGKVPLALQAAICRSIADGIDSGVIEERSKARLESASGMRGIASLLSEYPSMHMPTELDPPGLLATPLRMIDLLNKCEEIHSPAFANTKCTPVASTTKSDLWPLIENHLKHCLGDLYGPVWRFLGSSLLGRGADRRLLWLHGPGNDGKSTLVKAIRCALGEYAALVAPEVFSTGARGAHLHELGSTLAGARLAMALEVEGSLAWDRLKGLSGGDEQVSKRAYGKVYSYDRPPCLVLVSNHPPTPPDDAAADRLIVGKLSPPDDPDERLMAVLRTPGPERDALASACLRWLLNGCIAFLADGIGPVPRFGRPPGPMDEWWAGSVAAGRIIVGGSNWTALADILPDLDRYIQVHEGTRTPHNREVSAFLRNHVAYKRMNTGCRYNLAVSV